MHIAGRGVKARPPQLRRMPAKIGVAASASPQLAPNMRCPPGTARRYSPGRLPAGNRAWPRRRGGAAGPGAAMIARAPRSKTVRMGTPSPPGRAAVPASNPQPPPARRISKPLFDEYLTFSLQRLPLSTQHVGSWQLSCRGLASSHRPARPSGRWRCRRCGVIINNPGADPHRHHHGAPLSL